MQPYNAALKQRAQELRKHATPHENRLWYQFLRDHKRPFARQKIIGNYIVDFFCPSKKLIIEIDGNQHYTQESMDYDSIRTDVFESLGLRVIRFTNDEIDNAFKKVCNTIQQYLADSTDD